MRSLWVAVSAATRVEVRVEADGWTPCVLIFDNGSKKAKDAKRTA